MKKVRFLALSLFACSFALAGCYVDLGFMRIGSPEETNETSNKTNNTNNNNNNGGNQNSSSLLDTLKSISKPIAASALNKSESSITFGEFESETAEADVFYYDSSSLTFVDIEMYYASFNTSLADTLKAYLPSGVTLVENNDYLELLEEYGAAWYDRIYSDGTYSYDIYVEAYDEMSDDEESYPAETYGCIFIYKTSQQSAFDAYMSEEE